MRHLALILLLATPAMAQVPYPQDHPLPLPDRDVDVTYRVEAGAQSFQQRSRFDSAAQRMRVDMPTPGVYSIMDYRTHAMSFVVEGDRASLDTPMPPPADPAYTRLGTDQVAGLPCTEWQTTDTQHQAVVTCTTTDGIMLRVRLGSQPAAPPIAVATRVTFGPLDPGLFNVPPDFSHVTPPPRRSR